MIPLIMIIDDNHWRHWTKVLYEWSSRLCTDSRFCFSFVRQGQTWLQDLAILSEEFCMNLSVFTPQLEEIIWIFSGLKVSFSLYFHSPVVRWKIWCIRLWLLQISPFWLTSVLTKRRNEPAGKTKEWRQRYPH